MALTSDIPPAATSDQPKKIGIYVTDSAWCTSIVLPREIFHTAQRFSGNTVVTGAENPTATTTSVGGLRTEMVGLTRQLAMTFAVVSVQPEISLADAPRYDAILLPTLWQINNKVLDENSALYPWLRQQYAQGALIVGQLTGSYLMAEAGLLNHQPATTHWHYADNFRLRYPAVELQAEQMITAQNRLYCSSSLNASMDICIHLVKHFCGPAIAQQCERYCLMGTRRNYRRVSIDLDHLKQHHDTVILAIQNWLEKHYAEPIGIPEVAARFGISQRNLSRRFKRATGDTPHNYLQRYRLEVAKELLQSSDCSIQQICFDVGYESLTVFGRRFRHYAGTSPTVFRRQTR